MAFRIAEDIDAGCNDTVLRTWRKCILSATVVFEFLPTDLERYVRGYNIRQAFQAD